MKIPMQQFVGLTALTRLVYIALHIPYLKDEQPVGILVIARPGMGKSMLLTRFKSDNIVLLNDITGYGLEQTVRDMEGMGKGYVIIPDFLRLMARKKGYEAFLTLTNIILEEGLSGIRRADVNIRFRKPVHFGIITAMTDGCYRAHYDTFAKIGFASRFGTFAYNYEKSDYAHIEKLVSVQANTDSVTYEINPDNLKEVNISIGPKAGEMIKKLGKLMANGKHVSFRSIKFVRKLCKARALAAGHSEIKTEDIREVFSLIPFFIPPFPISTDLEYYLCNGVKESELSKHYEEEEIYRAKQRLLQKGLDWNYIANGARKPRYRKVKKNPFLEEE